MVHYVNGDKQVSRGASVGSSFAFTTQLDFKSGVNALWNPNFDFSCRTTDPAAVAGATRMSYDTTFSMTAWAGA